MSRRRAVAVWSPEAIDDIHQIWDHYEQDAGLYTAEKIVRGIEEVVAAIEDHPFIGRARDELRRGIRSLAAPPHVVFYRVVSEMPEIIRVLDGRRDIEEIFAADPK
jgi:toxin ParE1/3/4